MNKKKISIIIPIYNSESTIEQCLNSIFNQSYNNYEIICIDDGSTDNSSQIIKNYSCKHNNLKYYYQQNSGPSSARNMGIEMANGDYLMFIDSDDFFCNNHCFEKIMSDIKENDILVFNYDSNSNSINDEKNFLDFIIINGLWAPWGKIVKKTLITQKFNTLSNIGEDLKFWYDNSFNIKSFIFKNYKFYHYSILPNSIMRSKSIKKNIIYYFNDLNEILSKIKQYNSYYSLLLFSFNSFFYYSKIDNLNYLNNRDMKFNILEIYKKIISSNKIKITKKIKIFLKFLILKKNKKIVLKD